MNTITKILAAAILLCPAPAINANPDITDLLKGAASALKGGSDQSDDSSSSTALSGLKGVVEGLITKSDLSESDLVGSWEYSAPAVAFESDNFLQEAGGAAASGIITDKLAPYYEKAGITDLTATFNDDGSFSFQLRRLTLSGTYEKDTASETGDFNFNFKAAGKIPVGNFKAHVEKVGTKLTITFDVSKLITLVNTIANVSGQSTLKSVASVLNSYEGMNCGFELTPVK